MRYIILFIGICIGLTAFGQLRIKGVIVDAAGVGLDGVSIQVDGSKQIGYTGKNGFFGLDLEKGTTLVTFSLMGYEDMVVAVDTLSVNKSIRIELVRSFLNIQEVEISTGFQRLPKERSTGSYDHINKELLNQQVSTNLLGRLEAVANGLVYNRSTTSSNGTKNLQIRGISTLMGDKGPLIILDNFPYEGDVNNINPNDVEDITILKDAAASSIWGARAGNGVIVITTKNGKLNAPLSIDFNSNVSSVAKPNFNYLDQLSVADFIDVERFLFDNKYRFSDTSNRNRPPFTEVYEILFAREKGKYTKEEADRLIENLKGYNYFDQLKSNVYRNGFNQQYALNISGGSQRVGWITSAGYDRNVSDLNSDFSRLNLRLSNTYKPINNFEIGSSIYLTQARSLSGRDGYQDITAQKGKLPPYTRIVDEEGNAMPVIKDYRPSYLNDLIEQSGGRLLDWNYYPMTDYKHRDARSDLANVLINTSLRYEPWAGLSLIARYVFEEERSRGLINNNTDSYFARNLINRYSIINNNGAVEYQLPYGGIMDRSSGKMNSHQIRGQVGYEKTLGNHEINVLGGAEIRHTQDETDNFRIYGLDEEIWLGTNVDFTTAKPVLLPVGTRNLITNTENLNRTTRRFVSTFANMGYTFASRYTATLSARKDASNIFGVNANAKWRPLWSAGMRYELSKEPFYKNEMLPYLVARITYGLSGNISPTRSAMTTITYGQSNPYSQTPTAYVSQFANPDLRWEKIAMFNAAVDFSFKNKRVGGSIEYYRKNADDLFGSTRIDYTTGINTGLVKNVAKMKAQGIDINLNSQNIVSAFQWMTTVNFSYNSEKIDKYYLGSEIGSAYVTSSSNISSLEGKPAYALFSYKWRGLDPQTGDPLGDINGEPSNNYAAILGDSTRIEDLVFHGSYSPTVFGSLGNDFSWKGFRLSIRLTFKMGYYFRRSSINYSNLAEQRIGHSDYTKRWMKPGDELVTDVPSMVYPLVQGRDSFYEGAEVNVSRGDHIRLQYINLNYTLPNRRSDGRGIKNMQVYLNMSNLGVIWRLNKHGIDPEYLPKASTLAPLTTALGCRMAF